MSEETHKYVCLHVLDMSEETHKYACRHVLDEKAQPVVDPDGDALCVNCRALGKRVASEKDLLEICPAAVVAQVVGSWGLIQHTRKTL